MIFANFFFCSPFETFRKGIRNKYAKSFPLWDESNNKKGKTIENFLIFALFSCAFNYCALFGRTLFSKFAPGKRFKLAHLEAICTVAISWLCQRQRQRQCSAHTHANCLHFYAVRHTKAWPSWRWENQAKTIRERWPANELTTKGVQCILGRFSTLAHSDGINKFLAVLKASYMPYSIIETIIKPGQRTDDAQLLDESYLPLGTCIIHNAAKS